MVKGSLKILGSNIVSTPFNLAKVFIIVRVLDPPSYGVLNLFTVILSYSVWFEFGILSGMDKMIPFLRGQSNYTELNRIKNTAFTGFNLLYLFLACIIFVAPFMPFFSFSNEINTGIRLLSVIILLSALQNFYLTLLRANKQFGIIGTMNVIFAASAVLCLLLIYKTTLNRLHATLVSLIMAYIISLLFGILRLKLTFRLNLNMGRLKQIINTGFPIVIIGIGFVVFTSIDRWIIARYLTKSQLGYYALGVTISNFLFGFMAVFAYTFFPWAREKFGKDKDLINFDLHVNKIMKVMSYIVALPCCLLIVSLPFIYKTFFYKYLAGLSSANFLIFGIFSISIATISGTLLVAIDKQKIIVFAQAVGIVAMLIANYFAVRFTSSILGVAAVTAFIFSLYSFFIISCSLRYTGGSYIQICKVILRLFLPFILGLLIIGLLKFAASLFNLSDFIIAILGFFIISVSFIAFLYIQDSEILNELKIVLNYKKFVK